MLCDYIHAYWNTEVLRSHIGASGEKMSENNKTLWPGHNLVRVLIEVVS